MDKNKNGGSVMVLSLIFICIFSALGMITALTAGKSLTLAWNHQQSNRAFEAASSGLDITRRWFIDDVNGFTGIYHVLSTTEARGFIVDVNETGDPNLLNITVTGFTGEFQKTVGGDFVYHENPGWQFLPATYFEK